MNYEWIKTSFSWQGQYILINTIQKYVVVNTNSNPNELWTNENRPLLAKMISPQQYVIE